MGDRSTSLVDTHMALEDAPKLAHALFERLVDRGVIVPELRDDLQLGGFAFPLHQDFRGLDDLEGWGSPRRTVNQHSPEFTRIKAIAIDVTGHGWQPDANGQPELIVRDKSYGLFMNFEGGFSVNCPACQAAVELGADGSEGLYEALDSWCQNPESAVLSCAACNATQPLSAWRSAAHEFAAGHLGITMWGEHLLGLTERPTSASAVLLKALFSGADDSDPAVVFCNL